VEDRINRTRRHRTWLDGALCVALSLAVTVITPAPASAYEHLVVGKCDEIRFSAPPRIIVHMTEWYAGNNGVSSIDMLGAIISVADDFDSVGATTADITALELTHDAFTFGRWYNDPVPTIHVGFISDPTLAPSSTTARPEVTGCQYDETHIRFQDAATLAWHFGQPDVYYAADDVDDANALYFRPVVLHELLHAFGLDHTADDYAFMNSNDFPWANRLAGERIRPLPDDVAGLRHLYPGPGSRSEVAVLTTWFEGSTSDGAAYQRGLCVPSLGTQFASSKFFGPCGTGGPKSGSTQVCPDDLLHTRFTVANFSTEPVHLDVRLWLSTDEAFNLDDPLSTTHRVADVGEADSALQSQTWLIPSTLVKGTEYYVIIEVAGTTATGVSVQDWIPMRGTVVAKAVC
jgi:hypothetical protein